MRISFVIKYQYMPIQFGALVEELLTKAGVDPADPKYKSITEIALPVDDAIAGEFRTNLLGVKEARSDKGLRSVFHKELYDTLDLKDNELMDKYGLPDDIKTALKAEKNTVLRREKIVEAIDQMSNKKYSELTTGEKKDLVAKINELTGKLQTTEMETKNKLSEVEKQKEHDMLDFIIQTSLETQPYANKDLSATENAMIARTRLEAKLKEAKAIIAFDKESRKPILRNAETPDADFLVNGKSVSYTDYLSSVLAEGNMVTVSNPGGGTTNTPRDNSRFQIPVGDRIPLANQAASNKNAARLAELG